MVTGTAETTLLSVSVVPRRMSAIQFECLCGQRLTAREGGPGWRFRCPACGRSMSLPDPDGPSVAPAPAPTAPIRMAGFLDRWRRPDVGKHSRRGDVTALLAAIEHPDPEVRAQSAEALDRHPRPAVARALLQRTQDESAAVRDAAWGAVSRMFLRLVESPEVEVSERERESIIREVLAVSAADPTPAGGARTLQLVVLFLAGEPCTLEEDRIAFFRSLPELVQRRVIDEIGSLSGWGDASADRRWVRDQAETERLVIKCIGGPRAARFFQQRRRHRIDAARGESPAEWDALHRRLLELPVEDRNRAQGYLAWHARAKDLRIPETGSDGHFVDSAYAFSDPEDALQYARAAWSLRHLAETGRIERGTDQPTHLHARRNWEQAGAHGWEEFFAVRVGPTDFMCAHRTECDS